VPIWTRAEPATCSTVSVLECMRIRRSSAMSARSRQIQAWVGTKKRLHRSNKETEGRENGIGPVGAPLTKISPYKGGRTPFSREQIKLLEKFADHVGIAIENSQLFEEVQAPFT
jgi:hypothetical protein